MRPTYDLSPLYRSVIGVDRLAGLLDAALESNTDHSWPPFDVEKTGEDAYRITLAVAGFRPEDLTIVAQPNLLVIKGARGGPENDNRSFLHRGIAGRGFERRFELADYVVVRSASQADGMLCIELEREVPDAMKPRRIEIGTGPVQSRIEDQKAA